ncbi:hypothetical protein CSOJ01_12701 [Colletotrichum sojae]|uniref:Zn(2)-C6 fungal-type domain-containing protein n=1 Tax=Colletotrichum sojae TaxID=2175907 RepID=A0A8H6IV26_9PEZI|nr:hypothetical protein CSOJ01_12701 [Colletotrichum sojae]
METVLRDACDNCHRKKSRCHSEGSGACVDCRQTGQACVFSPRRQMGRPRREPGQKRAKTRNLTIRASTTELRRKQQSASNGDVPVVVDSILPPSPWSNSTEISPMGNSFMFSPVDMPFDHEDWMDLSHGQPQMVYGQQYQPPFEQAFGTPEHELQIDFPGQATTPGDRNQAPQDACLANGVHLQSSHIAMGQSPPLDPYFVPDSGEMKVYRQLSQLLFALHTARETYRSERSGGGTCCRQVLERIFMLGSSLCDVLSARPRGEFPKETTASPCLLLSVSVISTLVDIYQYVLDCVKKSCPPTGDDHPVAAAVAAQTAGTHHRLQVYSDAGVMDFHLGHLLAVFGDCQVDAVSSQMQGRLQEVRKALQGFMDKMRPPRRCGSSSPGEPSSM